MTTKELLNEYGDLYKFWDKERQSYMNPLHVEPGLERMEEIIKEIEASIRKEVVEDILKLQREVWVDGMLSVNDFIVVDVDDIKEYALSKGITLK